MLVLLYTYIHSEKTNIFGFFSQAYIKILKNAHKRQEKNWYIVPCLPEVVPFPMPYLISLKVPAFSQYSTCWDQGYKCLMEGEKSGRGVWGAISPLWPRYHPIWFKTSTLKENCLSYYSWVKKNNIWPFPAYTYIHKTNIVSFLFCFFCTFP